MGVNPFTWYRQLRRRLVKRRDLSTPPVAVMIDENTIRSAFYRLSHQIKEGAFVKHDVASIAVLIVALHRHRSFDEVWLYDLLRYVDENYIKVNL